MTTYTIYDDEDTGEMITQVEADSFDEALEVGTKALVQYGQSWADEWQHTCYVHYAIAEGTTYEQSGLEEDQEVYRETLAVDPSEECLTGEDHVWIEARADRFAESGGGMFFQEKCKVCMAERNINTSATDPFNGSQDNTKVTIHVPKMNLFRCIECHDLEGRARWEDIEDQHNPKTINLCDDCNEARQKLEA